MIAAQFIGLHAQRRSGILGRQAASIWSKNPEKVAFSTNLAFCGMLLATAGEKKRKKPLTPAPGTLILASKLSGSIAGAMSPDAPFV
jgi:hypothetical protein